MEQVAKLKRAWNSAPVLQLFKIFQKNIALAFIYQLTKLGGLMSCGSKDKLILYIVLCANTHFDVTYLANQWMVKNTKTWIARERNITFRWNKKNLKLCLRWQISRSYRFIAEVTFKETVFNYCTQSSG